MIFPYSVPTASHPAPVRPSILVVEDHDALRRCLMISLRQCYLVKTVATGEAALEALAESTFDLVLSSLQLPGLGGLEVCRAVKQNPDTATVPVVLMTVRTEPRYSVLSAQAGAAELLLKPFNLSDLHAVLKRCTSPSGTAVPHESPQPQHDSAMSPVFAV